MTEPRLTHLDASGRLRMVDVGAKAVTERRAVARAAVRMSPRTAAAVQGQHAPKGDVVTVARIAGIQAAKRAHELIPLAHPLPLSFVDVRAEVDAAAGVVTLHAEARTTARTGVEIEAMTAASVAALTVYDMVKGLERGVTIEAVSLVSKSGGREDWHAGDGAPAHDAAHRPEPTAPPPRAALITVSTSRAAGVAEDLGSPALLALAGALGADVAGTEIVSDDREQIEARLRHWADIERCDLVLTTGGTGLAPSDVTPDATLAVIEREAAGLAEAMRAASRPHTPNWPLSRATAGIRGGTLIVNLPGSPRAIAQLEPVLAACLPHALALLTGDARPASPGAH